MEDHTTPDPLHCPACGYDLRGTPTSPRCPECGQPLDPTSLRLPRLPWPHRPKPPAPSVSSPPLNPHPSALRTQHSALLPTSSSHLLPTIRAYTRTTLLVLLHPTRVGAESGKPLPALPDARAFRRVTVWLATLPLITAAAGGYHVLLTPIDRWTGLPSFTSALFEWLTLVSFSAGTFLFFHTLSATSTRFFHPHTLPPDRRPHAHAIAHYACAPLALMPLALPLSAASLWLQYTPGYRTLRLTLPPLPWLLLFLELSPLLLFPLTLLTTLLILKRATRCSLPHELLAATLLPPTWSLLALLFLLALPAATAYLGLIVLSFL